MSHSSNGQTAAATCNGADEKAVAHVTAFAATQATLYIKTLAVPGA